MSSPSNITVTLNEIQWSIVLKSLRTAIAGQEDLLRLTAKHRGDMSDTEYFQLQTEVSNRKNQIEQIFDTLKAGLSDTDPQMTTRSEFHVA